MGHGRGWSSAVIQPVRPAAPLQRETIRGPVPRSKVPRLRFRELLVDLHLPTVPPVETRDCRQLLALHFFALEDFLQSVHSSELVVEAALADIRGWAFGAVPRQVATLCT